MLQTSLELRYLKPISTELKTEIFIHKSGQYLTVKHFDTFLTVFSSLKGEAKKVKLEDYPKILNAAKGCTKSTIQYSNN